VQHTETGLAAGLERNALSRARAVERDGGLGRGDVAVTDQRGKTRSGAVRNHSAAGHASCRHVEISVAARALNVPVTRP
jgi:hypothetical protein